MVSSIDALPDHIIDNIVTNLVTADKVSVSRCNWALNKYGNYELYKSIVITEDRLAVVHSEDYKLTPYSILKRGKLGAFTETLKRRPELIALIQTVTILTSDSLSKEVPTNDFEQLYYALLASHSNLRYLENADYYNVRISGSFLQFNQELISKKNLHKLALYENDDVSSGVAKRDLACVKDLKIYQVRKLGEFDYIPEETKEFSKLSLIVENEYYAPLNPEEFQLNHKILHKFSDLQTLELNFSVSSEVFISKLLELKRPIFLSKLKTFSMTYVHSSRSEFEFLLEFDKLAKIIPFEQLHGLELKLNCEVHNCIRCIEHFVQDLFPNLRCVEKLSMVFITNENLLANSFVDFRRMVEQENNETNFNMVWSKVIQNLSSLERLKYLYLNLNDFTYIPFLKLASNDNDAALDDWSLRLYNFNISNLFLERRWRDYDKIIGLPLETLVLPDFFYNWKVFDIGGNGANRDLQFLAYLNNCECDSCHHSRRMFSKYSEGLVFMYEEQNMYEACRTELTSEDSASIASRGFKFPDISRDSLKRDARNYRFFYNFFIRSLKQRLPFTDKIFKNQSGLSILEMPFNDYGLTGTIDNEGALMIEHYDMFVIMIVHNLFDDLKKILNANRILRRLVLGGIYFDVKSLDHERNRFRITGVTDAFSLVLDLTGDTWTSGIV